MAEAAGAEPLLQAHGLQVGYGHILAVRGVTLEVFRGEIVALLGPNGAGKTSTLRGLSGIVRPRAGRVLFDGARIDGMDSQAITRAGAAHVPEGRRVFADQTVDANLALGGWGLGRGRAGQRRRRERADLVYGLFRRLADRRQQRAGSLSGGEQQMLSLGRALMTDPKLLMIDELSLGLAPIFVDELVGKLGELHRDAGVDLLLVEQFVHRALQLADRVYVLEKGRISFFGSAEEVAASGVLESAYQLAMKP